MKMASEKTLLEVTYHDDDDTGMYKVGEVDFGIHGTLDEFIERYGREGAKDIILTLSYLIYEIEKRLRDKSEEEMSANEAKSSKV